MAGRELWSQSWWSDALARRLLAPLPAETLADLRHRPADDHLQAAEDRPRAIEWLVQGARNDFRLARRIMTAWRQQHEELVAAVRFVALEHSADQCRRLLEHFGAENLLLELLTDDHDDGWQLAEWVIASLASDDARRALHAILEQLVDAPTAASAQGPPSVRIVIFGGHTRDENKMEQRLFRDSPFDVRWKICDKDQGSPEESAVQEMMNQADAVILVTSMISHNVMYLVKRLAQKNGIPWRTVTKATDLQLRAALGTLFPELRLSSG